jgi:GMP synthase (glutamine-hydrolysing)
MSAGREVPGPSAVVLQHRDDAPGGLLIDVLAASGFRSTVVRVDQGETLPDPGAFTLAVTLGCDGSDDDRADGLATELDWLGQADRAGPPVLGVGFGAQALAVALGGGVQRAPRARYGWLWLSTSIPGWISSGPWLTWQEDVIRLPSRARLLAHDRVGPQAFQAGGHLGLQFHPEITPKILGDWIAAGRAPSLDSQGVLEVTSREYAAASVAAERLLTTYVHSLTKRQR